MDLDIDETAPGTRQSLEFDGKLGGFLGIVIVNILLTIVTLGIFRFWSRTRTRRFLWGNTRFAGEPLEYRGRGLELLVGAILGFLIVLLPIFAISLLQAILRATHHFVFAALLQLLIFGGFFYLFGVGLYRSERYMLSRTSWRGIRGGMTAGGWRFGLTYIGLSLLRIVSLGFAGPFVSTKLWNIRMNETMFGSAPVHAQANWRPIYGRYVLALIGAFVIYGIAIFATVKLVFPLLAQFKTGEPMPTDFRVFLPLILRLYAIFIVAGLLGTLVMLVYRAAYWREIFGSTRLETLGLAFDATTGDWLRYYLGNVLIVVLTLGLGLTVMPLRAWAFYMRHIQTTGFLDPDTLLQTQLAAPTQGDGIADALGFSLMPF